ncbi:hypothetical protein, partial [Photobacterium damselae]|uniref:hypothetical protein n=1 Tax=Photobacterium damselae TaxID=38293 RepID=UPI002F3F63FA
PDSILESEFSFMNFDVIKAKPFSEQCSVINHKLVSELSRKEIEYISFPIEKVMSKIIINRDLLPENTFLYDLIANIDFAKSIHRQLDGVRSFWNIEEDKGTFMFWGVDERQHLFPVKLVDDHLVGKNGFKCSFAEIDSYIKEEKLLPTSALSILFLIFDLKLLPMGGIFQVSYIMEAVNRIITAFSAKTWCLYNNIDLLNRAYLHFRTSNLSQQGLSLLDKSLDHCDLDIHWSVSHQEAIAGCFEFLDEMANK